MSSEYKINSTPIQIEFDKLNHNKLELKGNYKTSQIETETFETNDKVMIPDDPMLNARIGNFSGIDSRMYDPYYASATITTSSAISGALETITDLGAGIMEVGGGLLSHAINFFVGKEAGDAWMDNVMDASTFVTTIVDNSYNDFYKNNEFGKYVNENAFEVSKYDSFTASAANTAGYVGGLLFISHGAGKAVSSASGLKYENISNASLTTTASVASFGSATTNTYNNLLYDKSENGKVSDEEKSEILKTAYLNGLAKSTITAAAYGGGTKITDKIVGKNEGKAITTLNNALAGGTIGETLFGANILVDNATYGDVSKALAVNGGVTGLSISGTIGVSFGGASGLIKGTLQEESNIQSSSNQTSSKNNSINEAGADIQTNSHYKPNANATEKITKVDENKVIRLNILDNTTAFVKDTTKRVGMDEAAKSEKEEE